MNTKTSALLSLLALPLVAPMPVQSSPLVSVGDNLDIFFNSTAQVLWQSNVFRNEFDDEEDVLFVVSPGFEFNFGRGMSDADLVIVTSYDIIRYDDFDDFDTETLNFNLNGGYRTSRLDLDVSAFFDEVQSATSEDTIQTPGADELIEYTEFGGAILGEYTLSPKFSVKSGFRYLDKSYDTFENRFSDRQDFRIPVDLFYEMTPKFDLSLGYAYRNTDIDDRTGQDLVLGLTPGGILIPIPVPSIVKGYDFDTHFFNAGVRGELLPKLDGFIKAGYRERGSYTRTVIRPSGTTTTNEGSEGSFGLDGSLSWQTTPKLVTRLDFSRDFGVGGEGDSNETTQLDLDLSYAISQYLYAGAVLGYEKREYQGGNEREDDERRFGLNMAYQPNNHWTFSAGYSYFENDSNVLGYSYDNDLVSVSARFRY